MKCYHYLHPIVESEIGCANQIIYANSNLDLFQQTPNTSEVAKEFVTKKLLIFKHYEVNPTEIKCHLQWWGKHETLFLLLVFWPTKF